MNKTYTYQDWCVTQTEREGEIERGKENKQIRKTGKIKSGKSY